MYIIRNISKGKVVLGDLNGLVLEYNQSIDLDKEGYSRESVRNSRNLFIAREKKKVEVGEIDPPEITQNSLAEMELRLREQIKAEIANSSPPTVPAPTLLTTPHDADLHNKMDMILKALASGVNKPVTQPDESMDSEPDDDKMLDIHRRAVNRITQGTSGKIESKSEVTENKTLDKNVDELSDFI